MSGSGTEYNTVQQTADTRELRRRVVGDEALHDLFEDLPSDKATRIVTLRVIAMRLDSILQDYLHPNRPVVLLGPAPLSAAEKHEEYMADLKAQEAVLA